MTTPYTEEFEEEVKLEEFVSWAIRNVGGFSRNLQPLSVGKEEKPLAEWIRWFLAWSEYEAYVEDKEKSDV